MDECSGRQAAIKPDCERLLKLEEFLPYRLNVLASLVSQALSRIYTDRYRIAVPEWRVIATVGQFGPLTGKSIGVHTHMHKTKVSRAVARLHDRKLVTRNINHSDMREAFISLTPAGWNIYTELVPIALSFSQKLEETLDSTDRATFDRALAALTKHSAALAGEWVSSTPVDPAIAHD